MPTVQSSLERLPVEMQWQIMTSLPDVRSLASTALTCRAYYSAFKANQDAIVKVVLINCVGSDTLPDAILVHRCLPPFHISQITLDHLFPTTQATLFHIYVSRFLQQQLEPSERPDPSSITWTMRDALSLSDFHLEVVSPLTQRFIQNCSNESTPPFRLDASLQSCPATRSEEGRIARALYRFEMFRRLFSRESILDGDEKRTWLHDCVRFFSKFAPWENSQLGCVYDFLTREMVTVDTDASEHDIQYGVAAYRNRMRRRHKVERLLELGLKKILEVASRNAIADRVSVLQVNEWPSEENHYFLGYILQDINDLSPLGGFGKSLVEGRPFYNDGDIAAEVIWRWSFQRHRRINPDTTTSIYQKRHIHYRQWGRDLWDCGRLQQLGVLKLPRAPAAEQEIANVRRGTTETDVSHGVRHDIYNRRGRGYWVKDD